MSRAMLSPRAYLAHLSIYAAAAAAAVLLAPLFGSETVSLPRVLSGFSALDNMDAEIFFRFRLPRVILAFVAGGALSLSGASLQVVLKNPLAEPFVLGIAGAGALGAACAMSIPGLLWRMGPFTTVGFFSLAGSLAVTGLILRLLSRRAALSMSTVLLAGVTINFLCGAAILLVRYLVSPQVLVAMDRWMMGGLDVVGFGDLLPVLLLLLPGVALLLLQSRSLNQLAFGEALAFGHGVDVVSVRRMVFLGTGLAAAAVVSVAGPIGFVGLIVPHVVRRLSGVDQRLVLPASFFAGGAFLIFCDLIARTVVAPTEMPVGIVTAVAGGPVFLRILFKNGGTHD